MPHRRVRSVRSRSFLLGAILLAIGAALTWGTWQEARLGGREIERVMTAHAVSVMDLITESGTHGLDAYRRWEDEVVQRLTNDAFWIARIDSTSTLDGAELEHLARIHKLHRINLFDANGIREASSCSDHHLGAQPRHDPREYLAPILDGEVRYLRIGIKPARFEEGSRLAVAVARAGGGAIVVNVSADSLRATLERVGPGHLFQTLGDANGLRYIAVQDRDGILVASADITGLSSLGDDLELASLSAEDPLLTREVDSPVGHVFEVARLVHFTRLEPVVLRIGLDSSVLDQTRAAMFRRTWMRTGILVAVVGLAAALLLAWQRHSTLDEEVRKVKVELRAREQEALRAQKLVAMGELASGVAHEIRNPLNAIHMIAQQLEREPELVDDLKDQVRHVTSESQRIEGIVQQFLTFARPRQPQFEWLDVGATASAVGRTAAAAFEAAGVRLTVKVEAVQAEVDRGFVTEIVENLLRNAREASSKHGEVKLIVEQDGSEVIIIVEDEGPGIAPEMHEKIFDLYYTTKSEGSGLGLALVTQMASAMRGRIRLDESYRRGARFVVHFPVRKETT